MRLTNVEASRRQNAILMLLQTQWFKFFMKHATQIIHNEICSDFRMWNSWCFRIEVRKDESEEVSEQLIDSFFIDFDVILCVAIVRCESLDETDREDIFVENIWLRDVADEIDEACETDEQVIVDFSAILYVDLSARIRRSEFLIDFRAWFWRRCSWSLLLKLNIWLQRRHVVDFFVDSDLVSNVEDERFELFSRVIVLNAIADSNKNFWDFSSQMKQKIYAKRMTSLRFRILNWLHWSRDENSWRASKLHDCEYARITKFLLKLKLCLQSLQITWAHVTSWLNALFNDSDTILNVAIERFKHTDETDELIAFSTSTCFRASCSRWCARRANCCSNLWRSASWHEWDSK